jgi:Flp pilus assembly CpaE family ATPase
LRNHFDLIVCDVGFNLEQDEEISSDITAPRRNQATLELLRHADQVVAVCSADVIGLARFIQSLEALKEAIQTTEVRWVVNRAKTSRGANASMVRQTLARFAGLTDVDVIDDDPKTVAAGVDLASPLCLVSPKSAVRVQMAAVAERCFALGGG